MLIKECPYNQAVIFKSAAAKERSVISDTPRTRWFMVLSGPEPTAVPIGVAGLFKASAGVMRIKGVFIAKAWRGKGYGDALTRHLVEEAERAGGAAVEAYALAPAWYERNGFRKVGRNAHGVDLVRRVF